MKTYLPLILLLIFSACSPRLNTVPTDIVPNPTVGAEDEDIRIELTHVATMPDFLFFELWMVNKSNSDLLVSPSDFFVKTYDDQGQLPASTDVIMQGLHIEKKKIKKRRRVQSIWAGLGILGSVAGVFWGGGNTFTTISEPAYATADFYDVQRFGRMDLESLHLSLIHI